MSQIKKRIIREIAIYLLVSSTSAYIIGNLYVTKWSWGAYVASFEIASTFYAVMYFMMNYVAGKFVYAIIPRGILRSRKTFIIEISVRGIFGMISTYISFWIGGLVIDYDFLGTAKQIYFQLFLGLVITLLVTVSIYAVKFYKEMIRKMTEAQEAQELAVKSELKALRAQINPHFLFNTLNSISALIPADPKTADRMTQKLAEIFRYVLLASEKETVTLAEELKFIEDYLDIEKTRFGKKLIIEKKILPETLAMSLPSLILQPIVENAIKHGISKNLNGGMISIGSKFEGDRLILTVQDNGDGFSTASDVSNGSGIGLKNVDERIKKTYGKHFGAVLEYRPEGACVTIQLPKTL